MTTTTQDLCKDVYTRPKRGKLTLVRKTEMSWEQTIPKPTPPPKKIPTIPPKPVQHYNPTLARPNGMQNASFINNIANKWTRNTSPNVTITKSFRDTTIKTKPKELCKYFTKTGTINYSTR